MIIEHIKTLAKEMHSRVVLLHVADGWAARTYGADAVSPEITEDTAYLRGVQADSNPRASRPRPSWHLASRASKSSSGFGTRGATWLR